MKKKSLIITMLTALVIFAFGATMAFATTTKVVWDNNYTKVTISGYTDDVYNRDYTDLTKTFNTSDGVIDIHVNAPDVDGINETTLNEIISSAKASSYFDLNKAVLAKEDGTTIKGEYANGAYTKGMAKALVFSAPDYVTNKTETAKVTKSLADLNVGKWQGAVKGDEDYDNTSKAEQNFTLTLDVTYNSTGTSVYNFMGVVPDKAVKVNAAAATRNDVKFFVDEVSTTGGVNTNHDFTVRYDGAAHKLVNNTVEGFTVSYAVFNKKTGNYDDVTECPTVTNTSDDALVVKATITDGYPATDTRHEEDTVLDFTLAVTSTDAPKFGFNPDGDFEYNGGNYGYYVGPTAYNEWDFVVVTPYEETGYGPEVRERNAKRAAAVAANEAEWKAFVQDFDKIEKTTKNANPGHEYLELQRKTSDEIDDVAFEALKKKYEILLDNFGLTSASKYALTTMLTSGATKADVDVSEAANVKDDLITFSEAPNMTYGGKKLIKNKKLKKTKTFTVVAAATKSHNTVSYAIDSPTSKITIDSATGLVTVAKGLKKGTYKVTVYAQTAAGNGYKACTADRELTIKIKKK